jgi:nicotinamidase/pyrazinamidase
VRTVFVDVDTQIDFLYPAGALYVPGAEAIVDRIGVLNHFAESQGIPVVSTIDAHSEDDAEFRDWPPHCVAGTSGQRKPVVTLLEQRVIVANSRGLPDTAGAQQILLEKQALNCFTNVNLKGLLERLGAERYVIYGVVTEVCVRFAALGLLETGRSVELVTDAVKELEAAASTRFFDEFTAKGGVLTTVDEVTAAITVDP